MSLSDREACWPAVWFDGFPPVDSEVELFALVPCAWPCPWPPSFGGIMGKVEEAGRPGIMSAASGVGAQGADFEREGWD